MKSGLLSFALAASAAKVTPVQKVIQLLDGMKAQGEKEMHEEKVTFSAYDQWCGDTSAEKANAIKEAAAKIGRLSAAIDKATADADEAASVIAAESESIGAWQTDLDKASKVRADEKELYHATAQDYAESLDALTRAIATLKQQNFDRKQSASLLQVLSRAYTVKAVASAVSSFAAVAQQPSGEANAYEFQSNGVIDMLKDLLSKFTEEARALDREEANNAHSFNMLKQSLTDQIGNANAIVEKKEQFKGKREADAAEASGAKSDTEAAHAADSKYLSDLKAQCSMKSRQFGERQKLRGEELQAIAQAMEILGSKSVSGNADKHLPSLLQKKARSFLQMSSMLRFGSTNEKQQAVSQFLARNGRKMNSKHLMMLATRVAENPFAKVSQMIENMITKLMEEANAEEEQHGWCETEKATNKQTRTDKTNMVEDLTTEIDALNASIAELTTDRTQLNDEISQLDADRAEATKQRNAEKKKNTVTIADAKEAQEAVMQALTVLSEFYGKAKEAESLAQVSQSPGEDAPASWDGAYKGMQGESGGVLGMLEVIQSDFARLESETSSEEAQAAKAYENFMDDSAEDKAVKQADVEHKDRSIAKKKRAASDAKKDLATTQQELDAAVEYHEKGIKPTCDAPASSYEERVAKREEEIQNLKEALTILDQ
jgi:hypothetical protein